MDARLTRTRHNFIVIFLTTPPLIANLSFLLLAVLPSLPQRASCSVDQRFQNCSLPTTCGGLEIAYPFYIQDQQPSYCGFLGFSISCRGDRPILSLSGHEYLIHHIFYRNQSLLVSDATLSNYSSLPSASCAPRDLITILKNLTLPETQFQLNHTVSTGLSLLYDCNRTLLTADELLRYEVTICSGNGTVLGIYEEDGELAKTEAKSKCAGLVEAAVEANWSGRRDKIEEALGSGFMLSWLAADCSLCDKSGGKCGFDYQTYHFNCYCPDRPHALHCVRRRDNLHLKIGLGIGIGGLASLTVFACIYVIRHRRWRASIFGSRPAYSDRSMKDGLEESNFYFGVPIFTNRELEEATHYFDSSRELGDGGFGTVYYGKLKDGREVAVKRLYEHNYRRVKQFMTEVQILTRLRHKNLVSLYGYTSSRSRELLLVYEYISNGTVSDHLHGERAKNGHLPWPTRMNIAIETATALTYLHASGIIHRDVKTDNILLDQNFSVKVADFGLSRLLPSDMSHISTAPQGTPGYVDPEYHQCYQLSEKSDVYSFGVVLVELISSMPAVDISRDKHEINLANLATNKIRNCTLSELIDPNLGFESDPETRRMIMTVAELAFKCLEPDKDVRPSMNDALEELKAISDGTYESDKLKIVDVSTGRRTNLPPSPECDATVLLKNVKSTGSPVSVTEGWGSSVPSSAASVSS